MAGRFKMTCPLEEEEQESLFIWAELQGKADPELTLLHHVPNGGARNKSTAAHLKRCGVKRGVPDICLPVARGRYHGLYIELKRRDKAVSRVSEEQKAWMERLREEGYAAWVAYGWEDAARMIGQYLHTGGRGDA